MKFSKEVVKKAHEMAREIKKEYMEVDYRVQFGLCLSYLLSEEEETEVSVEEKIENAVEEVAKTHGETDIVVKITNWKQKRIYINVYCFKSKFDCFIDLENNKVKCYNTVLAGAWRNRIQDALISTVKECKEEIVKLYK
ncbi:hypothetical protein [Clostridium novyi]|uniref:hypothetical protein n=1 Tax=Clostridium novyi TaxID=1542 RepID=UPI0004D72D24|nr:hypothetical protein [Clostridium novyi]KEI08018.1 hypothetical protein Z958_p0093 [Clostridium novyi B str. NCTC 9691]KEI12752.1 hypothetical protein Z958_05585 [Clostridium novyi B str. NCTC 9691]